MKYIIERISWIENRKKDWDQQFSELIMGFHQNIIDLVDELKDKFNDKDDPLEVHKVYLEYFEKAFEDLEEKLRFVEDDNDLEKLWNELTLNFSLWKEEFKNMSEKIDNYRSVYKIGYEIFSIFNRYLTKSKAGKYFDLLNKSKELDDKRENIINYFKELKEDFKLRIIDLDAEELFNMSNLDEKDIEDLNLVPGDEVRYYKNNDEENIAIISHNQDELKGKDNVRLVSKDGDQFEIDKSELIEIIPKHKTLNQEVSDKLKHIKKDPNKLDKLNDYLTDLEKTDEKLKDAYMSETEHYYLVTEDEEWLINTIKTDFKNWASRSNYINDLHNNGIYFTSTKSIKFDVNVPPPLKYESREKVNFTKELLTNNPIPVLSEKDEKLGLTNQFNYKIVSYKPGSVRTDNINFFMKENTEYGNLFNDETLEVTPIQVKRWLSNPNFKKKHIKNIENILRSIYKPRGHWKKYKFWGVMDLPWEHESWSILNKINTNYNALSIMINEINRALREGNSDIPLFDFSDKRDGTREFYKEYDRMMEFVEKNKEKIFLKLDDNGGSQTINKMINQIQWNTKIGNQTEELVAKYIPYIYPNSTDIKVPEGGGQIKDMSGGIDITFNLDGQEKTVQVKRCKNIVRAGGEYKIIGTSLSKHYNVDYFACATTKYLYFFEYNKEFIKKLMNGDLIIDRSLYIKSYKLK
jgi:hypothetical protein